MHERIKYLRKLLNLTQENFGSKVNLSQSQITAIETGVRVLTDRVVSDICREFQVNRQWLETGTEPVFINCDKKPDIDMEVEEVARLYKKLDKKQKKVVKDMIKTLLDKNNL